MKKPTSFMVVRDQSSDLAFECRDKIVTWLNQKAKIVTLSSGDFADMAIVIGDDDFIASKIPEFSLREIPTLGINTNEIGFLSCGNTTNWETLLDDILIGGYEIEKRATLELEYKGDSYGPFVNGLFIYPGVTSDKYIEPVDIELCIGGIFNYIFKEVQNMSVTTPVGFAKKTTSTGMVILPGSDDVVIKTSGVTNCDMHTFITAALQQKENLEMVVVSEHEYDIILQADSLSIGTVSYGEPVSVSKHSTDALCVTLGPDNFVKAMNAKK